MEKSKCEFDEWGNVQGTGQSRILDVLLCRRVNMDVRNGAMYRVWGSVELEEVETEGNTSGSKQQSFSLEVCDVQRQICTFSIFYV